MTRLCAATVALFFAVPAMAQVSSGGGSVTGRILCEDTGGPARRATVFLQARLDPKRHTLPRRDVPSAESAAWSMATFGATTDMDGAFAISNVAPGEYYVIARYPGYISADEYLVPGALSPELTGAPGTLPAFVQRIAIAAAEARHVEIHLKRGGTLSGLITYSDGAPVPYVALTPKVKLRNGAIADTMGVGASHTDGSGHYRIEGLPDGAYLVAGGLAGEMVPVFGGEQQGSSGLMVFAGGGMRPSKARVIEVTAPKEYSGVNITIPLSGVHEVSGNVTASDGHRLNHGLVRLYPAGESRFSLVTPLTADGTFRFSRIPADSYTVLVEDASEWKMGDYEQRTLVRSFGAKSIDIHVADADVLNVSLTVSPANNP